VDDAVSYAEKRSYKKVARDFRKLRSELLTATATFRLFDDTDNVMKKHVHGLSRGEVLWMSFFMATLVMYMVHMTVVIKYDMQFVN